MGKKKILAVTLVALMSITTAIPVMGENTSDVVSIEVYGGDLSAKKYKEVEFSVENLGVSSMALGSIINPSANIVTAERILEKKRFYDNGTDAGWMSQEQNIVVEAFLTQWKETFISNGMSDEEKFKAIYDYMISTITYVEGAPNDQSSYGALIDKRCACGGFSNAFLKMAKVCGLDAKFLLMPTHALNLIQVSGKWYATDVTNKVYNNALTTAIYYMHTTPELDPSIAEKVEKINDRNRNKGQTLIGENEKYQGYINEAISKNIVFHMTDTNLIPGILNFVENEIDINTTKQQHIYMVLYTDGKDFTEFIRTKLNYNGKQDVVNKIIASELKERSIDEYKIKGNASCIVRYRKELGEDGMDTFARLWIDEMGQNYVLLDCSIQLQ